MHLTHITKKMYWHIFQRMLVRSSQEIRSKFQFGASIPFWRNTIADPQFLLVMDWRNLFFQYYFSIYPCGIMLVPIQWLLKTKLYPNLSAKPAEPHSSDIALLLALNAERYTHWTVFLLRVNTVLTLWTFCLIIIALPNFDLQVYLLLSIISSCSSAFSYCLLIT